MIADNCLDIATDKSGCCVLQHCVENADGQSRERLVAEITANSIVLSEHPYGYVCAPTFNFHLICYGMKKLEMWVVEWMNLFQELCCAEHSGTEDSARDVGDLETAARELCFAVDEQVWE